ncbi:hypothetical protein COU37_00595 [Candidatus Micrarchaeota archaeon CG10_big_fil_rev_8_21_14_0_10_45_29]|nr:MAG: hypothetical protein COU37_00595 [Candidatus Micrarchaeota archaeon CG10_big_fil_rev_8_21_14_0_10_45_29]
MKKEIKVIPQNDLGKKINSLAFYSRQFEKDFPKIFNLGYHEFRATLSDAKQDGQRLKFLQNIDSMQSEITKLLETGIPANPQAKGMQYSVGINRHIGDAFYNSVIPGANIVVMVNLAENIASVIQFPDNSKRNYLIENMHYALGELMADIETYPEKFVTDAQSKMLPKTVPRAAGV